MYPFATMWNQNSGSVALLDCLPSDEDIFCYLESFQRRAQSCSFPHTPEECTVDEVKRFLSNKEHNAFVHPDMLALLFATLAQGLQNGVYDRCGGQWVEGAMEAELQKGDVYGEFPVFLSLDYLKLSRDSCCGHASLESGDFHEPSHTPGHRDIDHDRAIPDQ